MPYRMGDVLSDSAVPNWERRAPKWAELVEAAHALKPGTSQPVMFDTYEEARRAANAVRDQTNAEARVAIVRTRVVKNKDGTATLYIIRVNPVEK